MKKHQENGNLQAKERGFRENTPAKTLILDFQVTQNCGEKNTVVKATCILVWCGSPGKITHHPSADSERNSKVLSNDLILSSI